MFTHDEAVVTVLYYDMFPGHESCNQDTKTAFYKEAHFPPFSRDLSTRRKGCRIG